MFHRPSRPYIIRAQTGLLCVCAVSGRQVVICFLFITTGTAHKKTVWGTLSCFTFFFSLFSLVFFSLLFSPLFFSPLFLFLYFLFSLPFFPPFYLSSPSHSLASPLPALSPPSHHYSSQIELHIRKSRGKRKKKKALIFSPNLPQFLSAATRERIMLRRLFTL
jgi:hypothetical protein